MNRKTERLREAQRVAVCMPGMVGDSLLMLTVVHSLKAQGREVVAYGDVAWQLRDWLPGLDVRPAITSGGERETLAAYDAIIQLHATKPVYPLDELHPAGISIYESSGTSRVPILDQFAQFCETHFGVDRFVYGSGLRAPQGLRPRRDASRVVIHPTSGEAPKCWFAERFLRMACTLRDRGFDPQFIVSPAERPDWIWLGQHDFAMVDSPTLGDAAASLYESGWFIGNDSGVGHLASALGVPTLSLFARRSQALRWRPTWAPGLFVYPRFLPSPFLRKRYWRHAVTVRSVLNAFERLRSGASSTV